MGCRYWRSWEQTQLLGAPFCLFEDTRIPSLSLICIGWLSASKSYRFVHFCGSENRMVPKVVSCRFRSAHSHLPVALSMLLTHPHLSTYIPLLLFQEWLNYLTGADLRVLQSSGGYWFSSSKFTSARIFHWERTCKKLQGLVKTKAASILQKIKF